MPEQYRHEMERKLAWGRWIFGVLAAIFITLVIATSIFRDQQVAGCKRNDKSKIVDAHFMESAARARRAQGDDTVAAEYIQDVIDKRATIPMPAHWDGDPLKRGDNQKDNEAGCEHAYPSIWTLIFS